MERELNEVLILIVLVGSLAALRLALAVARSHSCFSRHKIRVRKRGAREVGEGIIFSTIRFCGKD
jgi:hypothetical protein